SVLHYRDAHGCVSRLHGVTYVVHTAAGTQLADVGAGGYTSDSPGLSHTSAVAVRCGDEHRLAGEVRSVPTAEAVHGAGATVDQHVEGAVDLDRGVRTGNYHAHRAAGDICLSAESVEIGGGAYVVGAHHAQSQASGAAVRQTGTPLLAYRTPPPAGLAVGAVVVLASSRPPTVPDPSVAEAPSSRVVPMYSTLAAARPIM